MGTESIVYFDAPGRQNTDEALRLAIEAAEREGIKTIVVASTTGGTATRAAEMVEGKGIRLVVIPHQWGWAEEPEFDLDLVPGLEERGHVVRFATMPFHTNDLYGSDVPAALANVLRLFGQGTKVCVEILLMAGDAGLLSGDDTVVAVAGTGRGADTAITATPATTRTLKQMAVHRILCKPLSRLAPRGA